jgi:hypothetical protein
MHTISWIARKSLLLLKNEPMLTLDDENDKGIWSAP